MANEQIKAIAYKGLITDLTNTTSSKAIIDLIYPIGATFISFDSTFDPNTAWNGTTWEKVKEGIFLEATEVAGNVGTETEAGLPNITGTISSHLNTYQDGTIGAIRPTNGYSYECTPKSGTSYNLYNILSFDASRSSAVYGKSDTVQPHSVKAFIWKRTA